MSTEQKGDTSERDAERAYNDNIAIRRKQVPMGWTLEEIDALEPALAARIASATLLLVNAGFRVRPFLVAPPLPAYVAPGSEEEKAQQEAAKTKVAVTEVPIMLADAIGGHFSAESSEWARLAAVLADPVAATGLHVVLPGPTAKGPGIGTLRAGAAPVASGAAGTGTTPPAVSDGHTVTGRARRGGEPAKNAGSGDDAR